MLTIVRAQYRGADGRLHTKRFSIAELGEKGAEAAARAWLKRQKTAERRAHPLFALVADSYQICRVSRR